MAFCGDVWWWPEWTFLGMISGCRTAVPGRWGRNTSCAVVRSTWTPRSHFLSRTTPGFWWKSLSVRWCPYFGGSCLCIIVYFCIKMFRVWWIPVICLNCWVRICCFLKCVLIYLWSELGDNISSLITQIRLSLAFTIYWIMEQVIPTITQPISSFLMSCLKSYFETYQTAIWQIRWLVRTQNFEQHLSN